MHYGMVINLKLCIGCNACVVACKAANGTPPGIFWRKVLEEEVGTFPKARRIFWPMGCMHCEEPACLEVCPAGAVSQREDGIVLYDGQKCTGCGYCILACPYEANYLWDEKGGYFGSRLIPWEERAYARHMLGTAQKCDFCASRLDKGLQPACAEACLTSSLAFGDLDDPNSPASQALAESWVHFRLKEELGTRPSVYYLTE